MKTLHLSIIIGIAGMAAIGITSFALIDLQSKNNESGKYVFEGNYEISKDMTGSVGGKSFFVSQSYPENYVNDSIQFHGVIFSTLDRNNDNNPSGFVSNLVRFSDGINETLTTGYGGHPPNTITILTKHQNPQAGLTRYSNGSVNFLVNAPVLVINGLKETYSAGEKINIVINFQGQLQYCEYPHVEVRDLNQNVVWKSKDVISLCISEPFSPPPYVSQSFDLNSGYGGPIMINTAGNYIVKVSLYGNSVEKGFVVT